MYLGDKSVYRWANRAIIVQYTGVREKKNNSLDTAILCRSSNLLIHVHKNAFNEKSDARVNYIELSYVIGKLFNMDRIVGPIWRYIPRGGENRGVLCIGRQLYPLVEYLAPNRYSPGKEKRCEDVEKELRVWG